VHPSWIYRLLARYREEDEAGLVPRSRRPKTSPTAFGPEVENEIVLLRKQLAEEGSTPAPRPSTRSSSVTTGRPRR